MARSLNQASLDLIKSFETKRNTGYLPTPNDVPTAGWGHTGPDVHLDVYYPDDRCEAWLRQDTAAACAEVERDITVEHDGDPANDLTDDEFGALVSLCFNIGRGNFSHSTVVRCLNGGDYRGAAQAFLLWNKQAGKELAGLDRRRAAEEELFLAGLRESATV